MFLIISAVMFFIGLSMLVFGTIQLHNILHPNKLDKELKNFCKQYKETHGK